MEFRLSLSLIVIYYYQRDSVCSRKTSPFSYLKFWEEDLLVAHFWRLHYWLFVDWLWGRWFETRFGLSKCWGLESILYPGGVIANNNNTVKCTGYPRHVILDAVCVSCFGTVTGCTSLRQHLKASLFMKISCQWSGIFGIDVIEELNEKDDPS